ncbi:unnamed protein product [Didymodactylos carnosus]|uniref:Protein kinase domain-containing protein n=1 Tax=Didymodactylos carnosus TaxID=1234261 RepID=A0A813VS14_9BILA|nr:unnamed protein product [Didymodactylos carnosus]CAF0844231.1 unnamed protein product [Didymodactylos carnosus]CAF3501624.1 unnamed protein product [Didymodactylos carnosus]CAF3631584.1 unnamed protein product [Didymodactylos carnosus]
MEKYRILGKKGEGTFSEVLKCQNVRDGTFWACKKMKQLYKSMEEIQQVREIRVLKQLNGHPNIIFLREIIFDKRSGCLCLIFELMTMNLYEYIRGRQRSLSNETVCKFMYQLLKALEYMHKHGFFHRDVKPENILIKEETLKLADFGSCRQIGSKQPFTEYISTRWYRAPECLLTDGYYQNPMDIWSCGCVMFEIITLRPLFPGSNEIDQINKIHEVLGTPSHPVLEKFQHRNTAVDFNFPWRRGLGIARHLTHCSSDTIDLINQLCTYDPDNRISATYALRNSYFDSIRGLEEREQNGKNHPWERNIRVTKTSEDHYARSDSSSSRASSIEENISPRSHVPEVTTQLLKPDFSKLIHPPTKAQSLIETHAQQSSIKKSPIHHQFNDKHSKHKLTYHNHSHHHNHSKYTNGNSLSPTNYSLTKNGPLPFLPRISGASAFSNYSTNTGNSSSVVSKTNYRGKNVVGYFPIMSYRYKK